MVGGVCIERVLRATLTPVVVVEASRALPSSLDCVKTTTTPTAASSRLTETVLDDMVAVIDEIGCERVALMALGVPVGLLFAAVHPERTTALVLVNASARLRRDDDYPQGLLESEVERRIELASQADTYNQIGTLAEPC